jgi:hypothetical protein
MFAVLKRGGMRRIKTDQAQLETETIQAPEARKLLLAGRAWENMKVAGALDFAGPDGLQCASLNISGCDVQIPERLEVNFFDISHCQHINTLPDSIRIHSVLEVAHSGLRGLPPRMRVRLHWEGVHISERVAFYPETLSGQEVLQEENLEVRRVMLERVGYERLMLEVGGLIVDRDQDAGGERKLIRIPLDDDEDIYMISVNCPSTAHHYVLRVPPHMRTCRQAVAWTAGFDNPDDYQPIAEA